MHTELAVSCFSSFVPIDTITSLGLRSPPAVAPVVPISRNRHACFVCCLW